MLETVLGGLIVAAISGITGFFLKAQFASKELFLPGSPTAQESDAYGYINGIWHEYHFSYDAEFSNSPILVHALFNLQVKKNLIAFGKATIQVADRMELDYLLRGEIRYGVLYFTMVCKNDPSSSVCSMYNNLLNDRLRGMTVALNFDKKLYATPSYMSKNELSEDQARDILKRGDTKFYG